LAMVTRSCSAWGHGASPSPGAMLPAPCNPIAPGTETLKYPLLTKMLVWGWAVVMVARPAVWPFRMPGMTPGSGAGARATGSAPSISHPILEVEGRCG